LYGEHRIRNGIKDLSLALATATPSFAAGGRHAAAAIGFGAGVAIGAAAAGSYDRGYAYDQGYAYDGGYADNGYAESGYGDYAYAPAPRYRYRSVRQNERSCTQSPGSVGYTPCNSQ